MARERVSLYFNTDIPLEKAMWDFISKDGRKSQKIKRVLEDAMKSEQFMNKEFNEYELNNTKSIRVENSEDIIDKDEIEGVEGIDL